MAAIATDNRAILFVHNPTTGNQQALFLVETRQITPGIALMLAEREGALFLILRNANNQKETVLETNEWTLPDTEAEILALVDEVYRNGDEE